MKKIVFLLAALCCAAVFAGCSPESRVESAAKDFMKLFSAC